MDLEHQREKERMSHEAAVEGLARSHGVQPKDVESLYESVLGEMKRGAVVHDFLPIFAAKKVKEMLSGKLSPFGNEDKTLTAHQKEAENGRAR
jgi:hypothetical protein